MKEQAFANSFAAVIAVVYVVCAAWVILSRNTFMQLTNSWIHGIDMNSLPPKDITASSLLSGLITALIAAWISGYLFARLYNLFAK